MLTTIPVTLATAGILGLVFMVLSFNVVRLRIKTRTMLGDGGEKDDAASMQVAVRMHGNFAEYVPFALLLLGGIEAAHADHSLVLTLAVMLVVGRLAHPFGMLRPAPNLARGGGAMLTWAMMIIASVTALLAVF
jgi:uncharacterized membrane protein YecN with MAPEG domain